MNEPTFVVVPQRYINSKWTYTPHMALTISVAPEIEDFIKDEKLAGPAKLVLHYDNRLYAIRFDQIADAVRFKLMFPDA